jgi:hypothetical protein
MYKTDLSYALFNGIPNTTSLRNEFMAYKASGFGHKSSGDVEWREYLRQVTKTMCQPSKILAQLSGFPQ